MQVVMLVLQIVIAVSLIAIILLQRTSQDGGGLMGGGGTMGGLFTARGSANLLTRVTAVLAAMFIINSLALGILASRQHQSRSVIDQLAPAQSQPAPVSAPASTAPAAPASSAKAPVTPAVPQVPVGK